MNWPMQIQIIYDRGMIPKLSMTVVWYLNYLWPWYNTQVVNTTRRELNTTLNIRCLWNHWPKHFNNICKYSMDAVQIGRRGSPFQRKFIDVIISYTIALSSMHSVFYLTTLHVLFYVSDQFVFFSHFILNLINDIYIYIFVTLPGNQAELYFLFLSLEYNPSTRGVL